MSRTSQSDPMRAKTIEKSLPPAQGIGLLQKQIQRGKELLANRPLSENSYSTWETITRDFLVKAFTAESPNIATVMEIGKYGSLPNNRNEQWCEHHRAESLVRQIAQLEGMVELLQTEVELAGVSQSQAIKVSTQGLPKVFVVHGRNEVMRETTARFLEKLLLEPIILHEKPNQGRTIIEKFTDYADVGFAVILLTGDDRGGLADLPYDKQQLRARQNVILELGYFLGRLDRQKVCALYEEGVEVPSDYDGVLFLKLDQRGAWKFELAREIKAAGIYVDMNLA